MVLSSVARLDERSELSTISVSARRGPGAPKWPPEPVWEAFVAYVVVMSTRNSDVGLWMTAFVAE
ncbi:hypothetical protein BAUCODRAFT_35337 [Baudoinia panamericana UAMH 10762]|uniref:Uncharacterized protein n=1 Tax=Baudoinia panamericana (strain UAMH 10762) TaxID=717646 RepID=M2MUV1_BAUPA|nr:uncharacterized protein BAUCODRAFT_35337 [Baudoinia panamericana UAMH 10762]EMC95353.1 hypothetical protein BAUCODRAFT_35337 [Baudoinia panamericana UAMH 10762]